MGTDRGTERDRPQSFRARFVPRGSVPHRSVVCMCAQHFGTGTSASLALCEGLRDRPFIPLRTRHRPRDRRDDPLAHAVIYKGN